MKHRPPKWYQFNGWVFLGALAGLGIAFVLFCTVQWWLFGKFTFRNQAPNDPTLSAKDVISMTATAIGGFTVGGVAVMQFRKHKWAEYQAKLDEDSRTGERLSKAIEHLGDKDHLHVRIGAVYEFKNLAEDSPRNKENIAQILTQFIKSRAEKIKTGDALPQDIDAAAKVLSLLVRELIEEPSEKARKRNRFRPLKYNPLWDRSFFKIFLLLVKKRVRPPQCVFDAAEILSGLAEQDLFLWRWDTLRANWLYLDRITLKNVILFDAQFNCTILWYAHFEGTILTDADVQGASLTSAHLENANLWNIRINKRTNFEYAHIDSNTRFDPGVREKYFPDFGKEKTSD